MTAPDVPVDPPVSSEESAVLAGCTDPAALAAFHVAMAARREAVAAVMAAMQLLGEAARVAGLDLDEQQRAAAAHGLILDGCRDLADLDVLAATRGAVNGYKSSTAYLVAPVAGLAAALLVPVLDERLAIMRQLAARGLVSPGEAAQVDAVCAAIRVAGRASTPLVVLPQTEARKSFRRKCRHHRRRRSAATRPRPCWVCPSGGWCSS